MKSGAWLRRSVIAMAACAALAAAPSSGETAPRAARTIVVLRVVGQGVLRSGEVACAAVCSRFAPPGALVTVAAAPVEHFRFVRWGGDCFGVTPTCIVVADNAKAVIAVFVRKRVRVTVTVGGRGTLTSAPAGLRCGVGAAECSAAFGEDTRLTLNAEAEADSGVFSVGGVGCRSMFKCTFTTGPSPTTIEVSAGFQSRPLPVDGERRLTIHVVHSSSLDTTAVTTSSGVACNDDCSWEFPAGDPVILKAVSGATWDGSCIGVGRSCILSVDTDQEVTVMMPRIQAVPVSGPDVGLSVTISGRGIVTGKFFSVRKGSSTMVCGLATGTANDCQAFMQPSRIVLRARHGRGWHFGGWGGLCAGVKRPSCLLSVSDNAVVLAYFRQ